MPTMTTWQFAGELFRHFWVLWAIGLLGTYLLIRDEVRKRKKGRVYRIDRHQKKRRLARIFPVYSYSRLPKNHWRPRPRALLHLFKSRTA